MSRRRVRPSLAVLALLLPGALSLALPGGARATGEALQSSPEPAAEAAQPAPEGERAPAAGSVARAAVTTAVQDREPVDRVGEVPNDLVQVFFFTELRDLAGRAVLHRWEHAGRVMGEVPFQVGGPRWRVWSSKNLEPEWLGEWTIRVVDEDGTELASESFVYTESAPTELPVPAAPPIE